MFSTTALTHRLSQPLKALLHKSHGKPRRVITVGLKVVVITAIALPLSITSAVAQSSTTQSSQTSQPAAENYRILSLTQAIENNPDNIHLYNSRGWYYFTDGAYEKTIADYTRVIELGPEQLDAVYQPAVYYVRGMAYGQLGNNDLAIQDLTIAAEIYEAQGNEAGVQEVRGLITQIEQEDQ